MTIRAFMETFVTQRRIAALLLGVSLLGGANQAAARNEFPFGAHEFHQHHHALLAPATPDSPNYRQYAPDRQVDILHLALDVTPDFKHRSVAGQAVIKFKPIAKPLEVLRLDAVDLNVSSVTATTELLGHQVTASEIVITFAQPIPPGRETSVTIRYAAPAPAKGLYFRTPEMGYKAEDTQLWTQGESTEARHWYPCFDYPNEKFTSEITCRVPSGMVVLSNGRKVAETPDPATGLVAVQWLHEKPHVNYLLTLVAGYYKKIEDKHRDIPLEFWVSASDLPEAPNSFKDTKTMMAFFEKEIGVNYPWNKYGQVCVRDFHWGGMENTTLTTLTDRTLHRTETETLMSSEGLVAHEPMVRRPGDVQGLEPRVVERGVRHLLYAPLHRAKARARDDALPSVRRRAKPAAPHEFYDGRREPQIQRSR
jgi:aminopeptidase N